MFVRDMFPWIPRNPGFNPSLDIKLAQIMVYSEPDGTVIGLDMSRPIRIGLCVRNWLKKSLSSTGPVFHRVNLFQHLGLI